jgi:hypothetical protein
MIYLSGYIRDDLPEGVGLMTTPFIRNRLPEDRVFATDTGCFNQPQKHDDEKYLGWLADLPLDRCLFATAPDRFGDGVETLRVALPVLPRIRAVGVRAALVLQPGLENVPWSEVDAVFLGGPDWWQQSERAHALVGAARARGLWCHRGRVNSESRVMGSIAMFDSVDGTFAAFGPDVNIPKMQRWVRRAQMQTVLGL